MIYGALAGAFLASGFLLLVAAYRDRRPGLVERVAPYARERVRTSSLLDSALPGESAGGLLGIWQDLMHATVSRSSGFLESIGSSAASVQRRLARSGSKLTYDELRLQQLLWAGAGFSLVLILSLILVLFRPVNALALGILALLAAAGGALARDWWLTKSVERRQQRIEAELPDVVELLALAVGAGEGPVAAMERVVALGAGDFVDELSLTLADVRSGTILSTALDHLERRAASTGVTRFCEAMVVALERGTPLSEVMRSQAADAREATRRRLMEEGGKREIAQMVPVVFLVLPVTVLFALFPGLFVLQIGL